MIRNRVRDFLQMQTVVRAAVLLALVPTAIFGQGIGLVSPELHKDGSVTFRLERSGAHEVLVALLALRLP